MSIESNNNIVVGNRKPIVLIGIKDAFVIESDGVILVVKKDGINEIKEVRKKVG
jgi:mannose-1-phosphate guanylyltransferase